MREDEPTGERDSPERFDPESMGGLIAAEHLARYRVAAALASGRAVLDAGCGLAYGTATLAEAGAARVVGIDASAEAIAEARGRTDGPVELEVADLRRLPFDDQGFELAVCFEAIEHVEQPGTALDELRRVLAPDGLLLVSSPHRGNYPPGNPYHVHEFTPTELRQALVERFANVALWRQHVWLATGILGERTLEADQGEIEARIETVGPVDPDRDSFTLALAGDGELPRPTELVVLAGTVTQAELVGWRELIAENRRLKRALANVTSSRSWRITAPLRALTERLRRE